MLYTEARHLNLPQYTDVADIAPINANFEEIEKCFNLYDELILRLVTEQPIDVLLQETEKP